MYQTGEATASARPLLLPAHWLALYAISPCSHRNTLLSDIADLEQTLVSETLCPYSDPKSSGRRFDHAW